MTYAMFVINTSELMKPGQKILCHVFDHIGYIRDQNASVSQYQLILNPFVRVSIFKHLPKFSRANLVLF